MDEDIREQLIELGNLTVVIGRKLTSPLIDLNDVDLLRSALAHNVSTLEYHISTQTYRYYKRSIYQDEGPQGEISSLILDLVKDLPGSHHDDKMRGAKDFDPTELRQALWDVYKILGGDTDGHDTPDAVVFGLRSSVIDCAKELREEYDRLLVMESQE